MDENAQILPKACTIMRESIKMLSGNSVISSTVVLFTSKSSQNWSPWRSRCAESEFEVKNLKFRHPDVKIKEKPSKLFDFSIITRHHTEVLRGATRWKFFLQASRSFLNQNFEIKPQENQNFEVKIFELTRKFFTSIKF